MYTFVLEPGGGRRSTRHLEVIVKQKFSTLEQTLPNKNVTYTPGGGKKKYPKFILQQSAISR